MTEGLIYVSLYIALFFEVFAMLTFFEQEAHARRRMRPRRKWPSVSIIVPCFNEERTVAKTVESLLALEYPKQKLSLVLINDGSTDNTSAVMEQFRNNPQIQIINKENGGKHTGLNTGIMATKSSYIGCLDADSFVEPDALKYLLPHFDNPTIGAVTASMSVFSPRRVLERMQHAEYLSGIALRHIFATWNGLYVTPGPFTIFRREVFETIGLFKPAHHTEDMEIALRMQRAGYAIQNAPRARVYTKVPRTLGALIKQRVRWTTGFLRNSFDYRDMFFNPRYGVLGWLVLPLGVLSIAFAIGLFLLSLYEGIVRLAQFVELTLSVPISFAFRIPTFDLFFMPITPITILGVCSITLMLLFMLLGARISKTASMPGISILWYLALYSMVAPLWLMRAVADVTIGKRRGWR